MAYGEDEPDAEGITRRQLVKGVALAGAGLFAGSLVASGVSLFPPPIQLRGELKETFVYTAAVAAPDANIWWNHLAGRELQVTDLDLFVGAAPVWRGLFDSDGVLVPGSGLTALVIRLPRDRFRFPPEFAGKFIELPPDDRNPRSVVVAIYDRCVHLCCNPGWHVKAVPEAFKDYLANPKTLLYGEDPIWCQCHNSQYDPMTLRWDQHPNGQRYIGARHVHGPAIRGLPAIPVHLEGDTLVGDYNFPEWYSSFCR